MNSRLIVFSAALLSSSAASAQQTSASAQPVTVQLECHDLTSSGNFVGSDETLVNGMACRQVKQKSQSASGQSSAMAPAKPTVQSTERTNAQTSASGQNNFAASSAVNATANATTAAPTDSQPGTAVPTVPATAASMKIVAGAKVYIAPMEGFESYLVAAFGKKKVQLIPVADQNLADYVIAGTSVDKKAGWAKMAFMGNIHSDNAASITMTDRRTGAIVYAYAVDKKSTLHGQQTTAEACAKHLEAHIEGRN